MICIGKRPRTGPGCGTHVNEAKPITNGDMSRKLEAPDHERLVANTSLNIDIIYSYQQCAMRNSVGVS
jgi:hypothetical protein